MKRKPAATRALTMPRSAIREIMNLGAGRAGIIHLEIGDPDLITPGHIIDAGVTFGPSCDGYVRIAFTIADHALRDGLERLRAFIQDG